MLKVTLRNYQKEAVKKCLEAFANGERGFLIGDKMGLGKTVEALAIADAVPKTHNSVLVIAPTALLEKWRYEVKEKLSNERNYEIIFASYSELADNQKRLAYTDFRYDLIIYDEVHYAKNYSAKRTQGALYSYQKINPPPVSYCSERLLGLSGTWPPNSVADCYTWLRATKNPLANGGFENFVRQFAKECYRTPQGWLKYSGFRNRRQFEKLLSPVFIARDIDDVTDEIPDGLRIVEYLKPSAELMKLEKDIFASFQSLGFDADFLLENPELFEQALKTFPDISRIIQFRRLQSSAKFKIITEYIEENIFPETKKLLMFCYFKETAEAYAAHFSKDIFTIKIDGTVPPEKRFEIVNSTKSRDECVLICTLDAVREGFDLIDFNVSVFAELDWRPWVLEQAEGRTRRIGQTKVVRWIYFVYDAGVDLAILKAVNGKKHVIDAVRSVGKN